MAAVEKSVLVQYSAAQMFDLVRNVPEYPQFLPWCGGAAVKPIDAQTEEASVTIRFKGIEQTFCTLNRLQVNQSIDMALVSGPFKALQGRWQFIALSDTACKVLFTLDYEFSSKMLGLLIGKVFHFIANSFVDGFVARAHQLYGKPFIPSNPS